MNRVLEVTIWAQAVYFFITAVWPIVHMPSFEAVTGPKTDKWLVQTVGALIAVVALALGAAAYHLDASPPAIVLGIGSAVALMMVDVIFVSRKLIGPIYLLDAAAEAGLVILWITGLTLR